MRLVLLFGGRSAEHEVSCVTAASVMAAADTARYELVPVGIAGDGRWVLAEPAEGALAAVGPDVAPADVLTPGTVVFPLLHGPFGEDGTAQGLLELARVPYVGCGVLSSALCMDKAKAKEVLAAHQLPVVPWRALRDIDVDDGGALDRAAAELSFPLFVKPANLGSSVAVSKVADEEELATAVKLALSYDEWVVVEQAVRAREIECGLLGYPRLQASVPGEVRPSHEFYDYEDKYQDDAAELLVPAPVPADVAAEVRRLAVAAGQALRVDGMARVDFFYEEGGRGLLLNEVNTIPGFTEISMYPRLWQASGLTYGGLIDELVAAAVQRHLSRVDRVGRVDRP